MGAAVAVATCTPSPLALSARGIGVNEPYHSTGDAEVACWRPGPTLLSTGLRPTWGIGKRRLSDRLEGKAPRAGRGWQHGGSQRVAKGRAWREVTAIAEDGPGPQRGGVADPAGGPSTARTSQGPGPPTSPTEMVAWGGRLPPTRRLLAGGGLGLAVLLGGNFLGATSLLLSADAPLARSLRVDVVYPVNGYKRCVESSAGFEFLYPASWVGDQTLLRRAAERAERERSLDLPALRAARRRRAVAEPLVAFGPPGSAGELNVSVIVAPTAPGFSLERFGSPAAVAGRLLSSTIAPPGSGKTADLVAASGRRAPGGGGPLYYTVEYSVRGPGFERHNVAVYAAANDLLYSLSAQAAESAYTAGLAADFRAIADSFLIAREDERDAAGMPQSL